jgi:hypothetical protein
MRQLSIQGECIERFYGKIHASDISAEGNGEQFRNYIWSDKNNLPIRIAESSPLQPSILEANDAA